MRRTKIIATLGPATDDEEVLESLFNAGVDAVRLNFSHGKAQDHKRRVASFHRVQEKMDKDIAIFADLQGPKMRLGYFENKSVFLHHGDYIFLDLDCSQEQGNKDRVWFDYPGLIEAVSKGSLLLLDDGKMTFEVVEVLANSIKCKVLTGGRLLSRKGISLFGGGVTGACLTDKDKEDLNLACSLGVDLIAVSFPSQRLDIIKVRECIDKIDSSIGIIAKIERKEAVENLDEIIQESDVIMVARGDLALEVGEAEVPLLQKHIIKQGRSFSKPVIVATHMMESMVCSPSPTRAEVSDVANAILDGADMVMLSAETAMGDFPLAVIQKVDTICKRIEKHKHMSSSNFQDKYKCKFIDEAIAHSAMYLANHLPIRAVVALTESGRTPRMMSRVKSGIPIYAISRVARSRAKTTMLKDVYPVRFDLETDDITVNLVSSIVKKLMDKNLLSMGDTFLLTHGDEGMVKGKTSILKVYKVEDVLKKKDMLDEKYAIKELEKDR